MGLGAWVGFGGGGGTEKECGGFGWEGERVLACQENAWRSPRGVFLGSDGASAFITGVNHRKRNSNRQGGKKTPQQQHYRYSIIQYIYTI